MWNWYWNCDGVPTTSEPPPTPDPAVGAITIVWNWHWDCPDDAPPTAAVTGSTICVGCNIAISIRIASPGDSAGVTQTTGTDATSIAAGVAAAAQAAAQALPEAAPQQPAVPPPAPPLPAAPVPPAIPPTVVVGAPGLDSGADDPPRRGAPDFTAGSSWHASATASTSAASVVHVRGVFQKTVVRTVVRWRTIRVSTVRLKTAQRAAHRQHSAGVRRPRPFPPAPPRTPAPLAIAPALTETHDTGGFTTFALGAGALGAFLLVLLGYLAPGLQPVRSLPGRAHPDPPG